MTENFEQLLNEFKFDISEGQVIDATITEVKRDIVCVDIGYKGESVIAKSEFLDMNGKFKYKEGDTVQVYVDKLDNGEGEIVLSYSKNKEMNQWKAIKEAFKTNSPIKAKYEKAIRGGIIVSLDGVPGFLPNSLVDVKPIRDLESLVGKVEDVKVIKIDEDDKSILVSRKAMFVENSESPQEILAKIKEGQVVKGNVKNITEYGVFVDLGGVDGLLHITDISWARIDNPFELFKMGQEVELLVSKFDPQSKKISLSAKALDNSPWVGFVDRHKVGDMINCKIVKVTDYGAFVLINSNLDGLIHNTEISWSDKNAVPSDHLTEGQEVPVQVIEIDHDKCRVSLSYKRVHNNPWNDFAKENQVGDTVTATVKSLNDFGVVVELENGCDATIPFEFTSWNPRERFTAPNVKVGDKVKAILKECNPIKERIQLSIRDLTEDPLVKYQASHKVGTVVTGKIVEVSNKNLTVQIADNIYGLVKTADAGIAQSDTLKALFKVGEEIKAKIINLNGRYVNLSIRELLK
jgi:small subunit ribosomal protein S1